MQIQTQDSDGRVAALREPHRGHPFVGLAANGSLHGAVTDPSGARVVKATVTVQDRTETHLRYRAAPMAPMSFPNWSPVLTPSPWPPRALLWRSRRK